MAKTPRRKGLFLPGAGGDGRRVRRPEHGHRPSPVAVRRRPRGQAQAFCLCSIHRHSASSRYGRDCFVFEVLETLTREPEQAEAQFRAELDVTRLSARGASFY